MGFLPRRREVWPISFVRFEGQTLQGQRQKPSLDRVRSARMLVRGRFVVGVERLTRVILAEAGVRHSSDGWHNRQGGLGLVKDAREC